MKFDLPRVFRGRGGPSVPWAGHVVRQNHESEEVRARWVCGQENEHVEVEPEEVAQNGLRMMNRVQDLREPSAEERATK